MTISTDYNATEIAKAMGCSYVHGTRIAKALREGTFASHMQPVFAAIYEVHKKTPNELIDYKNLPSKGGE